MAWLDFLLPGVGTLISAAAGDDRSFNSLDTFINDPLGVDQNASQIAFNNNLALMQQDYYQKMNNAQFDLQKQQFAYQKDYDTWQKAFDTRNQDLSFDSYYNNYQNTVADMQKAGLNPLALGGASSSASLASSSGSNVNATGNPSANAPGSTPVGSNIASGILSLISSLTGQASAKEMASNQLDQQKNEFDDTLNYQYHVIHEQNRLKDRELDMLESYYGTQGRKSSAEAESQEWQNEWNKLMHSYNGISNVVEAGSAATHKAISSVQDLSNVYKRLESSERSALDYFVQANRGKIMKDAFFNKFWDKYKADYHFNPDLAIKAYLLNGNEIYIQGRRR